MKNNLSNLINKFFYSSILIFFSVECFSQTDIFQSLQSLTAQQNPFGSYQQNINPFSPTEEMANEFDIDFSDPAILEEFIKFKQYYKIQSESRKNERTILENSYSERVGKILNLQGYEIFLNSLTKKFSSLSSGLIDDDYIMGPGDEVLIFLQGGINKSYRQRIFKDGNLYLDFTSPISAYGKKFSQLKLDIESRVNNTFLETNTYITIGKVRNIKILVTGQVYNPGQYILPGLSSVNEAIMSAGGIKKTGSLRKIKIIQNGETQTFDYYDFIFGINTPEDLNIIDGAIISVPPIGDTVAISGNSARPGIYEISGDTKIQDIFQLSGGYSNPFSHNLTVQRINQSLPVDNLNSNIELINGDIIISKAINYITTKTVKIFGAAINPGPFPIDNNSNLSSIFNNIKSLKDNAYSFAALVKTLNNETKVYDYRTINLIDVINNKKDLKINNNDEIFIFKWSDLNFLTSPWFLDALEPNKNSLKPACEAIRRLSQSTLIKNMNSKSQYFGLISALKSISLNRNLWEDDLLWDSKNQVSSFQNNVQPSSNIEELNNEDSVGPKFSCPQIFLEHPEILPNLIEHIYVFRGNLKRPGVYLGNPENFDDLLNFAKANKKNISISPDGRVIDVIANNITFNGAIRFPVSVVHKENLRLSDILKSKSFMKKSAYPFFAIINRNNIKTGSSSIITFNIQSILAGDEDINLEAGDEIEIFDKNFIQNEVKKIEKAFNKLEKNEATNLIKEELNTQNTILPSLNTNDQEILNILKNYDNSSEKDLVIKSMLESQSPNIINTELLKTNEISDNKNSSTKGVKIKSNEFLKLESKLTNLLFSNSVNIKGEIVNPGIYPIGGKAKRSELVSFAGGLTSNARNYKNSSEVEDIFIYPGESIFILPKNTDKEHIKLEGAFFEPRTIIPKDSNLKLGDVINSSLDLDNETYLYFGVLERMASSLSSRKFISFSPSSVILGLQNLNIKPGDKIKLFYKNEIDGLMAEYEKPNNIEYNISTQLNFLEPIGSMQDLVTRSIIQIDGEVSNPGKFLIADNYKLSKLIDIAGGFTQLSDKKKIKIYFPSISAEGDIQFIEEDVNLFENINFNKQYTPGSHIKISKVNNQLRLSTVQIKGSVKQPGIYRMKKNETIFDLLRKSGGLEENSFMKGLVFSREEEKVREKESISRLQRELDKGVIAALETTTKSGLDPTSIVALKELSKAASQYEPIGRVVGEFDEIETIKKIVLKSGDSIFIPKKPTSVSIVGEVMTPGSILWNKNYKAQDYIESSAGLTQQADKKKIFVISPNGQAKRLSGLWMNSNRILPGSTIVIPRKIKLASNIEKASSISSVIYQITLSLAGIDSILD